MQAQINRVAPLVQVLVISAQLSLHLIFIPIKDLN
ncbi:hypothetical protein B6N60_00863 [Richelia sinica FACHB-800]|uniref:Uncharacterized protein n=1 Tax=Richelia sinica FACHB-800 TaxID=1357546 RepID=A0A975Y3K1_9NOST|nr:hypothetical protein B6N60_00863 [Richelia sinica FACHB-800]